MPPATVMHSVTNEKVRLRTINIEIGPRFCMTSTKQNIYPLCTHCPPAHIWLPSYPFMLIWSDDGWSEQLQKAYLMAHIWFKLRTSDRISLCICSGRFIKVNKPLSIVPFSKMALGPRPVEKLQTILLKNFTIMLWTAFPLCPLLGLVFKCSIIPGVKIRRTDITLVAI